MKVKGNKNTIINTTNNQTVTINKQSLARKISIWSIITVLMTFIGWYFDYHKPIRKFLGMDETNLIEKKNTEVVKSVKPEERVNTGKYIITNQAEIDSQKSKRVRE